MYLFSIVIFFIKILLIFKSEITSKVMLAGLSLALLPGPLWPEVVISVGLPSMSKMHLFKTYSYSIGTLDVKYNVHTIGFQAFFVRAFRIVVGSWKFSMLLLYILWDDWPMFMISASNQQLRKELEYTLLKPDCHSWWISKMHSDTLKKQYAIELF